MPKELIIGNKYWLDQYEVGIYRGQIEGDIYFEPVGQTTYILNPEFTKWVGFTNEVHSPTEEDFKPFEEVPCS